MSETRVSEIWVYISKLRYEELSLVRDGRKLDAKLLSPCLKARRTVSGQMRAKEGKLEAGA